MSIQRVNDEIKNARCGVCNEKKVKLNSVTKFKDHLRQHAEHFVFNSQEEIEKIQNGNCAKHKKMRWKRVDEVHKKLSENNFKMIRKVKKFITEKPEYKTLLAPESTLPEYISLSQPLSGFSSSVMSKLSEALSFPETSFVIPVSPASD